MRLTLGLVLSVAAWGQTSNSNDWLLQNFAERISVEVSNPGSAPVQGLAAVSVAEGRRLAVSFPGKIAVAVQVEESASTIPGRPLATQVIDRDGDGTPDRLVFPTQLKAAQRQRVDIYFSSTLDDEIAWPQRVRARHNYGYNHEAAMIESELIGYRTYGGFFLDFMGRPAGRTGLLNGIAGYAGIRRDLGVGRDVFHIGATLGLGGVFLMRDGKVYQPPMNLPTYAHKVTPEPAPHYRIVSQGPLRAEFETVLDAWEIDGDLIQLKGTYTIDAGEPWVRCEVTAIPVRIAAGHRYEIGAGIRDMDGSPTAVAPGRLIATGSQNERDGKIGLGFYYDPAAWGRSLTVQTKEGANHAVLFAGELEAGRAVTGRYAVVGAWAGSGINDLNTYLQQQEAPTHAQTVVRIQSASRNPHPELVEAEAQ